MTLADAVGMLGEVDLHGDHGSYLLGHRVFGTLIGTFIRLITKCDMNATQLAKRVILHVVRDVLIKFIWLLLLLQEYVVLNRSRFTNLFVCHCFNNFFVPDDHVDVTV